MLDYDSDTSIESPAQSRSPSPAPVRARRASSSGSNTQHLMPLPAEGLFPSLESLLEHAQSHAQRYGYAVSPI
jgi:hypothetical protein